MRVTAKRTTPCRVARTNDTDFSFSFEYRCIIAGNDASPFGNSCFALPLATGHASALVSSASASHNRSQSSL
ncbi:unnamed protein product [Tilletia controversa]|nr:unnamed protein product [Tilletia controversa]